MPHFVILEQFTITPESLEKQDVLGQKGVNDNYDKQFITMELLWMTFEQTNLVKIYEFSKMGWKKKKNSIYCCIFKRCLEEPEIHVKNKKMPSGKRTTIEKRIIHTPSIGKHLIDEDIVIEKKCKNEFKRMAMSEIDCYLAYILMNKIFEAYQRDGMLENEESFLQ